MKIRDSIKKTIIFAILFCGTTSVIASQKELSCEVPKESFERNWNLPISEIKIGLALVVTAQVLAMIHDFPTIQHTLYVGSTGLFYEAVGNLFNSTIEAYAEQLGRAEIRSSKKRAYDKFDELIEKHIHTKIRTARLTASQINHLVRLTVHLVTVYYWVC